MGRKYIINDQTQLFFVTFTVVYWLDVFIRDVYKETFRGHFIGDNKKINTLIF